MLTRVSDSVARWEAQSEITTFGRALQRAAGHHAAYLGASGTDQMKCARTIAELLPRRIGAAQIALVPLTRDDSADLCEFVVAAREIALASIKRASTTDEIFEHVGDALDSLHAFLLTNEFVPEDYLEDAHIVFRVDAADADETSTSWERPVETRREPADSPAAADHDLALAA